MYASCTLFEISHNRLEGLQIWHSRSIHRVTEWRVIMLGGESRDTSCLKIAGRQVRTQERCWWKGFRSGKHDWIEKDAQFGIRKGCSSLHSRSDHAHDVQCYRLRLVNSSSVNCSTRLRTTHALRGSSSLTTK
ncbi:hypothetical protein Arad_3654 [Rhizobium rhizogenes K84]|uniref:Uncharacterized protein n=1 Tax=Rhizobium rhizogenes (strain K84 / ATCC BAA-868) TaxID=311403 RepID=B9J9F4_RHIR8|nr:hypothetical protein Arad_3654 [Rhizobium rhizogenes K84]